MKVNQMGICHNHLSSILWTCHIEGQIGQVRAYQDGPSKGALGSRQNMQDIWCYYVCITVVRYVCRPWNWYNLFDLKNDSGNPHCWDFRDFSIPASPGTMDYKWVSAILSRRSSRSGVLIAKNGFAEEIVRKCGNMCQAKNTDRSGPEAQPLAQMAELPI